jgi:hypothetical protein
MATQLFYIPMAGLFAVLAPDEDLRRLSAFDKEHSTWIPALVRKTFECAESLTYCGFQEHEKMANRRAMGDAALPLRLNALSVFQSR